MPPPKVVLDFIDGRPLTITLTKATERRVLAYIDRINEMDPGLIAGIGDAAIAESLDANIDHGLSESEREAGLWATMDGRLVPRAKWSWRVRLKYARKALRGG